ncbi:MAG: divalent metal cation transporter, partial [Planctomycetes bacterium]|nr:divalent metal cation transporter [Planctomycetota bacterium]
MSQQQSSDAARPAGPHTQVEKDRELILRVENKGVLAKLLVYTRLSGPGWLQSAITLGGGSLSSGLFLGILVGFAMMWLQPLAMIFGVIMLSAIGYVALSTGKRPFQAINEHVNPVLGRGWAIATLLANLVWALPQFSLGTASVRQNLLAGLFDSLAWSDTQEKAAVCAAILLVSAVVVWFYDKGGWGIKVFEIILKIMVAVVVLSFFGVVFKMSAAGVLDWGKIFAGLVPDPRLLFEPAKTFQPYLQAVGPRFQEFWRNMIVDQQQDVMVSAAATAVGINMTFLLPYSMLKKGWDRHFRGLAIFDLSTGLFIPFILATGCVVIASAARFHTRPIPALVGEASLRGASTAAIERLRGRYNEIAWARVRKGCPDEAAGVD